jgi:short-subunit dehydrogenase
VDRYELAHRLVVVTGASSGIGWETARAFASAGSDVVLVARREERLRKLADEIETSTGRRAHVVPADLSVRGEASSVAVRIAESIGEVDVLVNNAGSAVGGPVWAVADRDEARAHFEVDLWSPLALIGAVLPGMRRRGHGAVVNVTSIRVVLTWPSFGHASAACAALSQVTETLRLETRRFGLRVVEVIPGPIETPAQGPTMLIPGILEAVHGRLGVAQPEELAGRIVNAVVSGESRVFCPEETTRHAYEDPVAIRAQVEADVARLLPEGSGIPDEMLDDFVVGAEDQMISDARAAWELEHSRTT